jgi:replicative DNA helicase
MNETDPFPHAPIAEKSILSLMFRKPSNIAKAAAEGITADAFHLPGNKVILAQLVKARDAGHIDQQGEICLATFVQQAALDGTIDHMGGPANVAEVSGYAYFDGGWSAWCDQLREAKARRIALRASQTIGECCDDAGEAIKATREALDAMQQAVSAKTRSLNAKDACDEFITAYLQANENGDIPGTSSGIGEIDAVTGGLKPGELWTVGGPSSSGKSVLMYQVASEFLGSRKVVAIFSAELMAREIVGRLVTLRARVDYDAITNPRGVTKSDMTRIQIALGEMQTDQMWIDTSSGQSLDSIASESERIRDIAGNLDLIVVDYIQIIKGTRGKGDSREQEVASISGGLKQLAKKMSCPVITGSQLNDDGKVRESRAIEQDSDVLIVIENQGVRLKKVRNGQRYVQVPIALDGAKQKFRYFKPE